MRIIGGRLKRRLLQFPKTRQTRPLTDRAKETIFNILGARTESASVLDLFAGSGSFGIEALSRGAKTVDFVDVAHEAAACIRENLKVLGLEQAAQVHKMPVARALKAIENEGKKFDLIFVDPPHNKGLSKKTLHHLDRSDILRPSGIVVVRYSNRERLPEQLNSFCLQRSTKIGQEFVSLLVRTD